ncbi:hypothetical protein DPMN_002965 [Dreissena polymorpha]|uniref:Uncharacterized protein n=1 Tax=Dreissena polymorpha TaxID=45954 RepID=A0A9D4MNC2_DREPO|nr:hypothetical protein DPMN_002965 [Dreissena polymorpha]
MTSQHDIQDCRDEMTHASRGSQDTIREFPAAYLLTSIDEIKPANQKDSLLLQLSSY